MNGCFQTRIDVEREIEIKIEIEIEDACGEKENALRAKTRTGSAGLGEPAPPGEENAMRAKERTSCAGVREQLR